jgi:biotin carboxyl carrier protein
MSINITSSQKTFEIHFENTEKTKGTINGESFDLSISGDAKQGFHILQNNKSYRAEIIDHDTAEKTVTLRINGKKTTLKIEDKYEKLLSQLGLATMGSKKVNELKSPMPGLVLDIPVKEGDTVLAGNTLIILEAMKMENVLKAPADVIIKKINVQKGKPVEKNEILIQFE